MPNKRVDEYRKQIALRVEKQNRLKTLRSENKNLEDKRQELKKFNEKKRFSDKKRYERAKSLKNFARSVNKINALSKQNPSVSKKLDAKESLNEQRDLKAIQIVRKKLDDDKNSKSYKLSDNSHFEKRRDRSPHHSGLEKSKVSSRNNFDKVNEMQEQSKSNTKAIEKNSLSLKQDKQEKEQNTQHTR